MTISKTLRSLFLLRTLASSNLVIIDYLGNDIFGKSAIYLRVIRSLCSAMFAHLDDLELTDINSSILHTTSA